MFLKGGQREWMFTVLSPECLPELFERVGRDIAGGECEKQCAMTLLLRNKYGAPLPVLMQTHIARASDGDHIGEIYTMTPLNCAPHSGSY